MRNRYEVLSDSDENPDNESTNKLNPSKQGHKESKKSSAVLVQQHQKVQMTITLLRSIQQTFHPARLYGRIKIKMKTITTIQ